MENFVAHSLRLVAEVQSTIELNEHQGSAIRGSLFHALRNRFCMNREAKECTACENEPFAVHIEPSAQGCTLLTPRGWC